MLLKLNNNPCAEVTDYRKLIVLRLEKLEELDGAEVTIEERLLYKGLLTNGLAVKIAEEELKKRLARALEPKKVKPRMTQEEKNESVREFAAVTELDGIIEQTQKLIKNSHKRLEEAREESLKRIEEVNDKFVQLLKNKTNKWDRVQLNKNGDKQEKK